MTMSRDERRELAEINQLLSQESELAALAALFAQPPGGRALRQAGPEPVARHPDRSRRRPLLVALVTVLLAVIGACALGSVGGPMAIGAAAVLVVSAGLGLAAALRRYARD
jgi:hypothetical protein